VLCLCVFLQVFHCADAFATIVVVDAKEGRPSAIPFELQPVTEEERLRLEVGELSSKQPTAVLVDSSKGFVLCLWAVTLND